MRNKLYSTRKPFETSNLLAVSSEWISLHTQRISKISEWQCLETQLFTQAKQRGIAVETCLESDRPEAHAMKELDTQIEALGQQTEDLAANILSLPVESLAEVVAKIEVGLKIQGSEDWQPYALELVEDGLNALRKRLD
ncbi:MAG: hypothetical protein C0421_03555 [Hyphomonas sp.]|uniref:hypothetical protein n=1 Tax=Hyphomonas sp. TaxID=87 RepID=UPI0025BA8D9C|nr:hypothetical protein [Hyphomonas sp.]MBA4337903.1 hypothetical protein [Hyphomonas sp.]